MKSSFTAPKVMRQGVNPFLEKKMLIASRNPKAAQEIETLLRQRAAIDARLEEIQTENCLTLDDFCRLVREAQAERAAAVKLMTGKLTG